MSSASSKILEELSRFQQHDDQPALCSVRGLDLWGGMYLSYIFAAFSFFLFAAVWFLVQLLRLRRTTDRILGQAIYGFSFVAAIVRLLYILAEGSMVYVRAGHAGDIFAAVTYSCFFPFSASSFLSICQHWLRLIYVMEDAEEPAWHRNPLFIVVIVLLSLEALHDITYLVGSSPMWDAVYFVWLTLWGFFVALVGLSITWRLYGHLRDFYGRFQVFRKVMFSAFSISALATSFLFLSIVQAVYGRFYAWPSLTCWIIGRFLEASYLTLIIVASGPVAANTQVIEQSSSGSFASSPAASLADYGTCPNRLENFWIASPQRRGTWPSGAVPHHDDSWDYLRGTSMRSQEEGRRPVLTS